MWKPSVPSVPFVKPSALMSQPLIFPPVAQILLQYNTPPEVTPNCVPALKTTYLLLPSIKVLIDAKPRYKVGDVSVPPDHNF
jgi:hypothetical protein